MTTEALSLLRNLGWKDFFQQQIEPDISFSRIGRISIEYRDHFVLINSSGENITGHTTHLWKKQNDKKNQISVGDWVILKEINQNQGSIHSHSQRSSIIEKRLTPFSQIIRRASGTNNKIQILASNVDIAFIVSSCNQELDINRIERYLALLDNNLIKPILILNKCDLEYFRICKEQFETHFPELIKIYTRFDQPNTVLKIQEQLAPGTTCVFLGSSGVGKSTLTNLLLGQAKQLVEPIRKSDSKGRHTTTSRTLFQLPTNLGLIIDTPGLREIQLSENSHLDSAFSKISEIATECRFPDCKHLSEPNCAVKLAVKNGEISKEKLLHFQKLYFEFKKSKYSRSKNKSSLT